MNITDEHIEAFRVLYKEHFGQDISQAEALEKGLRLIRLLKVILQHTAKMEAQETHPKKPL